MKNIGIAKKTNRYTKFGFMPFAPFASGNGIPYLTYGPQNSI